jgi:uncharacterized protein YabE (DUF348 family)
MAGLFLLAVLLGVVLLGGSLFLITQKVITLDIDGQTATVYTHQATVGELLSDIGLQLLPQDALSPGPQAGLQDGAVVHVQRARMVVVIVDGQAAEQLTLQRTARAILDEAGITLGRYDVVRLDGVEVIDLDQRFLAEDVPAVIEVTRAVTVSVDDDGQSYTVQTTEPTVGEMLHALGMTLYAADEITPPLEDSLTEGMAVTIRRSLPLTIQVDGVEVVSRTRMTTVGGALTEAGLALVGEDYSVPDLDDPLPADGLIRVVRVSEDVLVERTEIPYETVYRADAAMELDTQRQLQAGAPGVLEQRTRFRYENGVEVSRVDEPQRVTQDPTDEVIAYGTQVVIRTLQTTEGALEYWRVIRMLATSYTPGTSSKPVDAPNYGIASTGVEVHKGIVAVDPEVIPYFTRVYVPGYGPGLAADTGGAINGRRIDLGYSDDDLELWYSWVDVYLLTPVPPEEDILYILP